MAGALCHVTIEAVLKQHSVPGRLSADEVIGELTRLHAERTHADSKANQVLGLSQQSMYRWVELWNRFFAEFAVESVEADFALSLGTSRPLVGRVDMIARSVDNEIWAVDWKTGQPNPKDQPQVETYAVWVAEKYQTASRVVAAVADIHNVLVRPRNLGSGALTAIRSMLRTHATNVEQALRSPTAASARPGVYCADCPVLPDCPEGLGMTKPVSPALGQSSRLRR
jgi:hypothetical protein